MVDGWCCGVWTHSEGGVDHEENQNIRRQKLPFYSKCAFLWEEDRAGASSLPFDLRFDNTKRRAGSSMTRPLCASK